LKQLKKSAKLANVLYDIRGPIMDRRQADGGGRPEDHQAEHRQPGPFGFDAPEEIQQDMIRNLPNSAGYSDSKGIFAARKAVMHYTQQQGIAGRDARRHLPGQRRVRADRDGDQRAAQRRRRVAAAGARLPAVDRRCRACRAARRCITSATKANGWMPDLDDIRAKITPRTKGIVVINPNNPTGVLYSDAILLKASSRSRASTAW
jgi:alanine-synthesizing transaminase